MSTPIRRPHQAVDHDALVRSLPPPPEYYEGAFHDDPSTIARKQLVRLQSRLLAAGRVPFYRRRWADAGFDPAGVRTLDDLRSAPVYTVADLRESIEASPPWGDYQGIRVSDVLREPARVYMSGGTTGATRPTLFTQWDREAGAILQARCLYMLGIRPGDVVLNSWLYSTHNGAWNYDEALYRWLNCVVIPTSAGTVTDTTKQVRLAIDYEARSILATGDYLMRIAETARSMGHDPATDFRFRALLGFGPVAELEATFGVPALGFYGTHEVQVVAVECPARNGLHVFEDAFVVEVIDPESHEPVPDGQRGCLCLTEIYKSGSPQIRYDTQDLTSFHPRGQCACGSWLRRIEGFVGRADNMVKLRGVNVWPEAVGEIVTATEGIGRDYFVRAFREGGRDELEVLVAREQGSRSPTDGLGRGVERELHSRLGVRIQARVVDQRELDQRIRGLDVAKPRHFVDERS